MLERYGLRVLLPLLLAAASAARAQAPHGDTWRQRGLILEPIYSAYRFDKDPGASRVDARAYGGRLVWLPFADQATATESPLASRLGFGIFHESGPKQDLGFDAFHTGALVEFLPLGQSLFERVDPVLTLSTGLLRTERKSLDHRQYPLDQESANRFTLAPGVGLRVMLLRQLGIRGELRDVMTFSGATRHNVNFFSGLSIVF
jgi:hypothetical protein